MDRYNTGNLAVDGSNESGALLSGSLMKAVHYYFTSRPLECIPKESWVVDEIIELTNTKYNDPEKL
jgi:hypothetical protein